MKDDLRTLCILVLFTVAFIAVFVIAQEMLNPTIEDYTGAATTLCFEN